jgi:hypothetical protein
MTGGTYTKAKAGKFVMRGLFRVLVVLVVFGGLVGYVNSERTTHHPSCGDSAENPCDSSDAEQEFAAQRDRMDYESRNAREEHQQDYDEYMREQEQPTVYRGGDLD